MERRDFIVSLGIAALGWPEIADGQEPAKLKSIGFLGGSTLSSQKDRVASFIARLRELGWIEDRTVAIEFRWAEGRTERYAEVAAEFVRLKVDIIVTGGAPAVAAARRATSTIPIVFGVASDPVGTGLVATLARPGGNVTGLSFQGPDLAPKRLELVREMVPGLRRLAVMANVESAGAVLELRAAHDTAVKLGIEFLPLELRRAEEIAPAITAVKDKSQALYVCEDALANANASHIIAGALDARLPTTFGSRENVDEGGLFSYGPNVPDLFRRAAEMVDKILRGAKPADIPVEQPTKFELVVNLKTAKALGIAVPQSLLAKTDETIE